MLRNASDEPRLHNGFSRLLLINNIFWMNADHTTSSNSQYRERTITFNLPGATVCLFAVYREHPVLLRDLSRTRARFIELDLPG